MLFASQTTVNLTASAAANITGDVAERKKLEAAILAQFQAGLAGAGSNVGSVVIKSINAKGEAQMQVLLKADATISAVTEASIAAQWVASIGADATMKASIANGTTFVVTGAICLT